MTKLQRIGNILAGLMMILGAWLILALPEYGYLIIILILGITFTIFGIRNLVYYFTMARFMVGGQTILIYGLLAVDFGMFSGTLVAVPKMYIMVYLVATYAVAGVVSLLRGFEAKRYNAPSWKGKLVYGMINIAAAVLSLVFIRSAAALSIIYGVGLIYSGITRIVLAFRKTAIVYIQ